MLVTYKSQQHVDRYGLAITFQADLSRFDKLVLFWGRKQATQERKTAWRKFTGEAAKKPQEQLSY